MRALLFDVDGVLVHGYHAKPEKQVRWDENLLADLGVDPERFRNEFIYDIFIKKVIVGQMSLLEALDRTLPRLGYRGPAMAFAGVLAEPRQQRQRAVARGHPQAKGDRA